MTETEQAAPPLPTAVEPSRVLVLTDDEQLILLHATTVFAREREDLGDAHLVRRFHDRVAYGDEYINEVDELTRTTLRKRRLEAEIRRCNLRIEKLDSDVVDEFVTNGDTGRKHAGTGASLSLVRNVWAKLDIDTAGMSKDEEQQARADAKAAAAEALEHAGLGALVRPDFNLQTLSAVFREQIKAYDELQRDLPEHKRAPRTADSFLPEPLRGHLRIDDTPHIQVRA